MVKWGVLVFQEKLRTTFLQSLDFSEISNACEWSPASVWWDHVQILPKPLNYI